MEKTLTYTQAIMRLSLYGLSNMQARRAMVACPVAEFRCGGGGGYMPADIDACADQFIDGLSIEACGQGEA
jgi:hypothetical protein